MSASVVDTSVIVAAVAGEVGRDLAASVLAGALISAVNWSEAAAWMLRSGLVRADVDDMLASLDCRVVPFDEPLALVAAMLAPFTRSRGLSLGDRACLALGRAFACPVYTADRVWAELDVGVEVRLIR